ncbi:hypothetical protein D9Q98_001499 [Chlorella vulgaris]|uniref:Pectin acetylesterase n=1 Tax=Chlorella vulgaris TaxID=3077 RepID=A0A9D4Z2R9_CHLVU|nr:hypothetical protein D9Q98_001499 [Chlorella vulgaris]
MHGHSGTKRPNPQLRPSSPRSHLFVMPAARGCLLAAACALLLMPHATGAAPTVGEGASEADEFFNNDGMPLMMPVNRTTDRRRWYFEVPRDPVGILVMLHQCGRNAEDFWPPSSVCPQCIGMPEGVSISRQGLARGYALLAINSLNREIGANARCWSYGDDAEAVREIVAKFQAEQKLEDVPVFFTGCSSGGSLALRLPGTMKINGIFAVAIALDKATFPPAADRDLEFPYPPVAYIHFADDTNTNEKVGILLEFGAANNLTADEVIVGKLPIGPNYFAERDAMISTALSQSLHEELVKLDALDENYLLKDDWETDDSKKKPWEDMLRSARLQEMIDEAEAEQLALKNATSLSMAQYALQAAGEPALTIQDVSPESVAASEDAINQEDTNPNFSESDGASPAAGTDDPYLSAFLLFQHIREEVAVAWAHHINLGDYTTAALMWLERCGKADLAALANTFEVTEPAELSPVRAVPAAQVQQTWQTCQAGGVPEDALQPSIVAETQADSEDGGESTGTAAAPPASGPATAVGGRRRLAEAGAAVVAAATAAMLQ